MVNNFENYSQNMEQFLKNQTYIINISDEKYKEKFMKALKMMIDKL